MPSVARRYRDTRSMTEALCAGLSPEDCVVQSMPDASPTKWHLAHTTWFFETFVLAHTGGYRPFHPAYGFLFNSYYEAVGARHQRSARGLLSRPSLEEVRAYRRHVDERMLRLLEAPLEPTLARATTWGLHHEQQHQELILTDIKHAFWSNPLRPAYGDAIGSPRDLATPPPLVVDSAEAPLTWLSFDGGLSWIGQREPGPEGEPFVFDNESPRHQVFLQPYRLASRPATNAEYLAFMQDRGYERPELWLSDGWQTAKLEGWRAPMYWEEREGHWWTLSLAGMRPVRLEEPVCHVSYYEADAYARWAGARLPGEAEWEAMAAGLPVAGNLLQGSALPHPRPAFDGVPVSHQLFGDVWEWTQSPYTPYPGYRPAEGVLGEYNGKFMCNQMVLRGGSCATPATHIRATYRNFFPAAARWQFSGVRLAKDP